MRNQSWKRGTGPREIALPGYTLSRVSPGRREAGQGRMRGVRERPGIARCRAARGSPAEGRQVGRLRVRLRGKDW